MHATLRLRCWAHLQLVQRPTASGPTRHAADGCGSAFGTPTPCLRRWVHLRCTARGPTPGGGGGGRPPSAPHRSKHFRRLDEDADSICLRLQATFYGCRAPLLCGVKLSWEWVGRGFIHDGRRSLSSGLCEAAALLGSLQTFLPIFAAENPHRSPQHGVFVSSDSAVVVDVWNKRRSSATLLS